MAPRMLIVERVPRRRECSTTSHGCHATAQVETDGSLANSAHRVASQVVNRTPPIELHPEHPLEVAFESVAAEGVESRCTVKAEDLKAPRLTNVGRFCPSREGVMDATRPSGSESRLLRWRRGARSKDSSIPSGSEICRSRTSAVTNPRRNALATLASRNTFGQAKPPPSKWSVAHRTASGRWSASMPKTAARASRSASSTFTHSIAHESGTISARHADAESTPGGSLPLSLASRNGPAAKRSIILVTESARSSGDTWRACRRGRRSRALERDRTIRKEIWAGGRGAYHGG